MTNNEDYLSNVQFLRGNDQFNKLPVRIQELILKSQTASDDFRHFFADGGEMKPDPHQSLAAYRAAPDRRILVNSDDYGLAHKSPEGDYVSERLFSIMAHEIGHDKERNTRFQPNISAEEYVRYCSMGEAKAIFNAFPIFSDLRSTEPSFRPQWNAVGYDSTGAHWGALYNNWRDGRIDKEAVIKELAESVPDFPYTRDDKTGDQFKTWRDYYLHEFHRQPNNKAFLEPSSPERGASISKSETDMQFDRMYEALASKDSQAIRAARQDYFQSQDGREFLQEVGEYRQTQEHRAHAQGMGRSPDGYSIGALTGKRDPRDWDHPDHALYSAIRQQLPAEVPDDMAAHLMLQAKQGGVDRAGKIDAVAIHDGKAWVLGKNFAGHAEVNLSQSPPTMQDTVRQSEIFDQQQAQQREQWLAQEQQLSRNGPSMSL